MTDHTAKNLVGRDLINLREALKRARTYVEYYAAIQPTPATSEMLMRIDTLVYKHADPELDIAKRWAVGDYSSYPDVDGVKKEEVADVAEEFVGWWGLNREGSVNRAYDYIDKIVKRLRSALEA
jgi:hypothetical protein